MKNEFLLCLLALGLLATKPAYAEAAPVKMWRLDCGIANANQLNMFSDTMSYTGQVKRLTSSCYLIKHGARYMIWDTGFALSFKGLPLNTTDSFSATLARSITDQLAEIGIKPTQIEFVGASHYHWDHVGQASSFAGATLLIGREDWALLTAKTTNPLADAALLQPWLDGKSKVDPVDGDRDIFGDGSVMMINLPGHTPGHHGLLVRLAKTGPVLLSGDLAHFTENLATNGVPTFNSDRADTLASFDRFKKLAASLKALVIIQHETADIAKLPAFPAAAE
jgi:glyoxylase-like metal-dependent hydrolase (beta-lactamase superfamily II)